MGLLGQKFGDFRPCFGPFLQLALALASAPRQSRGPGDLRRRFDLCCEDGSGPMKVTLERAALLKSLGHVHRVVERRNTIPILANVLLQAGNGQHQPQRFR